MSSLPSPQCLFHTLRHYETRQLLLRTVLPLRRWLARRLLPNPGSELEDRLEVRTAFPRHAPWNERDDVLEGRFRFLNREVSLGWPVDWEPEGLPLLWMFHLHYFRYLCLLEPDEQDDLCGQWIQRFQRPGGTPWHPFPTSVRIVNWVQARVREPAARRSLYRQAAYLSRATETHLGGNHLLENARALVLAGSFFGGRGHAEGWIRQGLEIYRRELPKQILTDGGHFERSPMYHAFVLRGCLDVVNVLGRSGIRLEPIRSRIPAMLGFLRSVSHPDGGIPLFNDASLAAGPDLQELLDYAERLGGFDSGAESAYHETGYYVHSGERLHLVMDAGPIGPDHLPAHSHADLFSFELSVDGRRFVTDSGVWGYEDDEMRALVRSTCAHNTVTIDGVGQAEPWGSFRMARRFPPSSVSIEQQPGSSLVLDGQFDGFGELLGDDLRHARRLECKEHPPSVRVTDRVTGQGHHSMCTRVHLHPDLDVECVGSHAMLQGEGVRCRLVTSGGSLSAVKSWYCPDFGVRIPRITLEIRAEGVVPLETEYEIHLDAAD